MKVAKRAALTEDGTEESQKMAKCVKDKTEQHLTKELKKEIQEYWEAVSSCHEPLVHFLLTETMPFFVSTVSEVLSSPSHPHPSLDFVTFRNFFTFSEQPLV